MLDNKELLSFVNQDYIHANTALIKAVGTKQAIWLSFMIDRFDKSKQYGSYFQLMFNPAVVKLGMNKKEQTKIISNLKAFGIIKTKKVLLPKEMFLIKVSVSRILELSKDKSDKVVAKTTKTKLLEPKLTNSVALSILSSLFSLPPLKGVGRRIMKEGEDVRAMNKSKKEEKKINRNLDLILKHWNSLGKPLTKHKRNRSSNLYRNILKNTRKSLLNNSLEEVLDAISNYHHLLNTNGVSVFKAVSLAEFFKFSEFNRERMRKSKFDMFSWFEESKKGYDYLLSKYTRKRKDNHPGITKLIKNWWIKTFPKRKISVSDENNFILFGKKLTEFIEKNESRLGYDAKYPARFVGKVTEILEDKELRIVHTGYLVNDIMFSELSDYLFD